MMVYTLQLILNGQLRERAYNIVQEEAAVCCSVLQCVAVCCITLCCSVYNAYRTIDLAWPAARECLRHLAGGNCSVSQCVAVHCSVLQYIVVCCSVYHTYLGIDLAWSALQEGIQQHAGGGH